MKLKLNQNKSIALIGFMGAGKTTIARTLAKKMAFGFIDIDKKIEEKFQQPTATIFNNYGEKKFREIEKNLSIKYASRTHQIISLGGGAFLQNEIKNTYLSECIVIYLEMTWDYWKERLDFLVDTRPLLQGKNVDEIQTLFEERIKHYSNHHLKININGLSVGQSVEKIIEELNYI